MAIEKQGFVKPVLPRGVTDHGNACMEKIRQMLANPRPPGNWGAHEVIAKHRAGEKVTLAALELAEKALAREGSRVPGEDDE